jgi:hypothetical protein
VDTSGVPSPPLWPRWKVKNNLGDKRLVLKNAGIVVPVSLPFSSPHGAFQKRDDIDARGYHSAAAQGPLL